jgi:hypothetical protein
VSINLTGCSHFYPVFYDIIILDKEIEFYAYTAISTYYAKLTYTTLQEAFEKICFELENHEFEYFKILQGGFNEQ